MSVCQVCQSRRARGCAYEERTKEYFEVMIGALRHVAYRMGYALAVHGSLKTDIDLLAAPWRDSAICAASFAEEIRLTVERIIGFAVVRKGDPNPTQKPCGRLAWSFYLQPDGCVGPYIDLSVMPRGPQDFPKAIDKPRRVPKTRK